MTLTVPQDQSPDPSGATARPATPAASPVRDRASRNVGGITKLFAQRPELRGIHAPADLADDAVRWSA